MMGRGRREWVSPWRGGPVTRERPRNWWGRAVDRFAEWLLPDPDARVTEELERLRDQGEQGPGEKPPQKG